MAASTRSLRALTTATFDEEVRSADVPVVVDVWAEWCPPCKALEPILESIAADHADELSIRTINGDEHPDIVRRFGVMSLPTLLVFKDGELVHRMVGARGKHHLLQELAPYLR